MTAYVDESLRLEGEGLYVLAAVLVPDGRADAVRATLRDQLRRGQRRYHWRRESDESRHAMLATIRSLGLRAVVVTRPVDRSKQERARRQCLVRLLWELGERREDRVVLESRHHADALDRRLIEGAIRSGWAPPVRYAFGEPDDECLLWLPDVVAGAVSAALADARRAFLDEVAAQVAVVSCP